MCTEREALQGHTKLVLEVGAALGQSGWRCSHSVMHARQKTWPQLSVHGCLTSASGASKSASFSPGTVLVSTAGAGAWTAPSGLSPVAQEDTTVFAGEMVTCAADGAATAAGVPTLESPWPKGLSPAGAAAASLAQEPPPHSSSFLRAPQGAVPGFVGAIEFASPASGTSAFESAVATAPPPTAVAAGGTVGACAMSVPSSWTGARRR